MNKAGLFFAALFFLLLCALPSLGEEAKPMWKLDNFAVCVLVFVITLNILMLYAA